MASKRWWPRSSDSFKCFSPTSFWLRTIKSSKNRGAAKPAPQTSCSSITATCALAKPCSSEPSVSIKGSKLFRPVSSITACSKAGENCSKSSRPSVKPAAMACPPNLRMRPGYRLETKSSTSRKWTSGIERPDPRNSSSPAGANASVGRKNFSLSLEATKPTTP